MKNRNQIFRIYGFIIAMPFIFNGCNDFLDQQPISSLSPDVYWQSKEDADNWIAGIYNQMQRTLQNNWFDWGEYRSDNVRSVGTGTAQTIMLNNQLSSTNQNSATSWVELYTTISLCNFGIKYLPDMIEKNIDGSSSVYQEYIGQCYGMRALMYFYVVRVWGRAPLITETIEGLNQPTEYPRSSIAEVKERILTDAETALKMISDITSDPAKKFYLSKTAIYALLTDVYAWFQEYDKVIETSDALIVNANIKWIAAPDDWKTLFTNPVDPKATENIFVMYWNSLEYNGGMGYASRLGSSSNTSNVGIKPAIFQRFWERYNPEDLGKSDARWWFCFDTVQYKSAEGYDTGGEAGSNANAVKFGKCVPWDPVAPSGPNGVLGNLGAFIYEATNVCNTNMPIYRYADVMTLRAEALAMTGKYDEALEILQKVRSRVGYTPEETDDPTNFMAYYDGFANKGEKLQEVIVDERQLEFLAEGKRWFDLCRIGRTVFTKPYYDESGAKPYKIPDTGYYEYLKSKMNNSTSEFVNFEGDNMGRIFFPIVSGAFTANSQLRGDQNPPYDE
jgi:hypothetical protein